MKKHMLILPLFLVAVVALILGAAVPEGWAQPCDEEFEEFEVFIEINATDLDAGLQGILDGEPWYRAAVKDPGDETIFSFNPGGNLGDHGVTEVPWESNEPCFHPCKEADPAYKLSTFLELFPAGTYTAEGMMVEGGELCSDTELTHDLPAGPYVTSHEEDDEVERGTDLIVTWDAVTKEFDPMDPQGQKQNASDLGSAIVGYIVVAEYEVLENPDTEDEEVVVSRALTIDVAPNETSATIPADFLPDEPGAGLELEFKIEVGAREESGNLTFTEIPLEVVNPS